MSTTTTLFQIVLGDWSGDGHSETENHLIRIHGNYSFSDLKERYQKNITKIGFGYGDIAGEYLQPTITAEQMKSLRNLGLVFTIQENEEDTTKATCFAYNNNENVFVSKDNRTGYYYTGDYIIFSKHEFIKIAMFMVGANFEDDGQGNLEWVHELDETPILLGAYRGVSPEPAGYGLYI
jgi:hypothetical protein